MIGKWGARILTHIPRIDARGVEAEFQATPLTDAKAVKSVVEKFRVRGERREEVLFEVRRTPVCLSIANGSYLLTKFFLLSNW